MNRSREEVAGLKIHRRTVAIPAPPIELLRVAGALARPTIRFLVRPGWVRSANDLDSHWISARAIMDLNGVDRRECVVIDPLRPRSSAGHDPEFLASLLELTPMTHCYSPVGPAERRSYPKPRGDR